MHQIRYNTALVLRVYFQTVGNSFEQSLESNKLHFQKFLLSKRVTRAHFINKTFRRKNLESVQFGMDLLLPQLIRILRNANFSLCFVVLKEEEEIIRNMTIFIQKVALDLSSLTIPNVIDAGFNQNLGDDVQSEIEIQENECSDMK